MLNAHLTEIEATLLAISKVPGNSGHPIHKGTPRERFVSEFLKDFLSETVAIGTGEIIDATSRPGQSRNQFDIVIYKRNFPKIHFGAGICAFLSESVVATIEVKSTLDQSGLEAAIRAAVNAKALTRNLVTSFWSGHVPPSILNYVVAYDGPASMKTVHGWIDR